MLTRTVIRMTCEQDLKRAAYYVDIYTTSSHSPSALQCCIQQHRKETQAGDVAAADYLS